MSISGLSLVFFFPIFLSAWKRSSIWPSAKFHTRTVPSCGRQFPVEEPRIMLSCIDEELADGIAKLGSGWVHASSISGSHSGQKNCYTWCAVARSDTWVDLQHWGLCLQVPVYRLSITVIGTCHDIIHEFWFFLCLPLRWQHWSPQPRSGV